MQYNKGYREVQIGQTGINSMVEKLQSMNPKLSTQIGNLGWFGFF